MWYGLLVQVSMVQMVGKYLVLPYWRLLGDDCGAPMRSVIRPPEPQLLSR